MTNTINKKDLIAFRKAAPTDLGFIYSTWALGLYHGNSWFHQIDQSAYFQNYKPVILAILNDPKTEIKIACIKDDPDVILGYSVSEGTTLHYVYVKGMWRKIGIARELIPESVECITHLTDIAKDLLKKKFPDAKFNPFIQKEPK